VERAGVGTGSVVAVVAGAAGQIGDYHDMI
jgi:hypothetical protein